MDRPTVGTMDEGIRGGAKPLLVGLRLVGLHFFDTEIESKRQKRHMFAVIYRGFIPFILLINLVFSFGNLIDVQKFDHFLLNSLISSIWFLQVFLFSFNNFVRCRRWDKVYKLLDEYFHMYKMNCRDVVRTAVLVIVVSYAIWIVVAGGFLVVSLSHPAPPTGFYVLLPEAMAPFIQILMAIAYFFFVSTWFLLTSQFAFISYLLCRLLSEFYMSLKEYFFHYSVCEDRIEKFRQQHEKICHLIKLCDAILSMFIMVTVGTTIPLIVMTLYFVIFVTDDVNLFAYVATWWSISLSSVQLTVVFLAGGLVNYKVHRPLELLYSLDLNLSQPKYLLQLTVFLNRLTSQPIGLSAMGLFVLDKPTIITFVGSIATYAIVMVQFKPGDLDNNIMCNCTT